MRLLTEEEIQKCWVNAEFKEVNGEVRCDEHYDLKKVLEAKKTKTLKAVGEWLMKREPPHGSDNWYSGGNPLKEGWQPDQRANVELMKSEIDYFLQGRFPGEDK